MRKDTFRSLIKDARHFQILSLSVLFIALMLWSNFDPSWGPSLKTTIIIFISAISTQFLFSKIFKIKFEWRSAVISTLSLSFLLKLSVIWLYPIAAFIAMSSKFLLRANGKHIFNPVNFAIVVLLLVTPELAWISPAQWGREIWLGFLIIGLAGLVLSKFDKSDIAFFFLGFYWGLLALRMLWLGDPIEILLNQMQQGSILIFAFFMITDPKTTPNHRIGRIVFAFIVALLGFFMQFSLYISEGIFYALALICIITPLIDKIWTDKNFKWRK